jgi:hypothetical protein
MTSQGGEIELNDVAFVFRKRFTKRRRGQESFSDTNEIADLLAIGRHTYTAFRLLDELREGFA